MESLHIFLLLPPATPRPAADDLAAPDCAVPESSSRCGSPAQQKSHAKYFDPVVELRHGADGVIRNHGAILDSPHMHTCGRCSLQLPVKYYGAIAQDSSCFRGTAKGACEGLTDWIRLLCLHHGQGSIPRIPGGGSIAPSPARRGS